MVKTIHKRPLSNSTLFSIAMGPICVPLIEELDKNLYIRYCLKNNSGTKATNKLLSSLMTGDMKKADVMHEKEFDQVLDGGLSNDVCDIDSAGKVMMEKQARSPRELWHLLQVRPLLEIEWIR